MVLKDFQLICRELHRACPGKHGQGLVGVLVGLPLKADRQMAQFF